MRLLTKESRNASRQIQFNYLLNNGYTQTTYKELDFFTKSDGKYFTLKVFRGNAANHAHYMNYRTEDSRTQVIENFKRNLDSRAEYKAEQKEKNKGKSSAHAGAAAAIRAELKANFPNIKFSVTSETYSGGNSVRIGWADGPTTGEVEAFSSKYQYGSFDGMNDIYEYTNSREDIPQVKYVFETRTLSAEILDKVAESLQVVRHYKEEELNSYRDCPAQHAREMLYNTSIPHNYTDLKVIVNPNRDICNDYFIIEFTAPAPEPTEPTKGTSNEIISGEITSGEINIIDYSEKAFAVVGDTKPIKDKLKALGGSFNARLSCGAGWIFSKKKLDEVTKALTNTAAEPEPQPEPIKETLLLNPPQEDNKTTLRDEVVEMIEFFEITDKKIYSEVTESTKQIAKMQEVTIYDNIQDITAAANSGQMISLFNLSQLVNR